MTYLVPVSSRPDQTLAPRSAGALLLTAAATVAALLAAVVGTSAPATAAVTMPNVLLKGGAAVVGFTYTATPDTGHWPAGTEIRYQWMRGDHNATTSSFVPIAGATGPSYTNTADDHDNTVKVHVQAVNGSTVVGQKDSGASNWIMWRMAPPTLNGVPHVGQVIRATLGPWVQDWDYTLTWRNTGVPIPGANGVSYRARPADAGKEISLLALGQYTYPNGVHPIDRYASRMRIRWATQSIMRGASRSRGVLRLTAIAYAAGANQAAVRGHVTLYDGKRLISQFWVPRGAGRKALTLRHLRPGVHRITMAFDQNPWFDASRSTRSFRVG